MIRPYKRLYSDQSEIGTEKEIEQKHSKKLIKIKKHFFCGKTLTEREIERERQTQRDRVCG